MEHKEEKEEFQEVELQVKERRERLLSKLKDHTDRLLNIGHLAHRTVQDLNRKSSRPRSKKKCSNRVIIAKSSVGFIGAAGIALAAEEANRKLLGNLAQEATLVVDEANKIIMEMVELLRDAGETGLSFEELSLTFTLDDDEKEEERATALSRDIDSIVARLMRRHHDINVMCDKLEGRGIK